MIRHTFSLLNGIGEKLERSLWRRGILTWDDFLRLKEIEGISPERKIAYDDLLTRASIELGVGNAEYFARILKRREHWRLFDIFGEGAVCLDIETNGLQPGSGGYATVVGLYDGHDCRCFVRGENLTVENLNRELSRYKYLITFYGAAFDVPFLIRTFPGIKFDIPHFDLCFTARRLEMNGGLKKLEQMLGIDREECVRGLNGYDAEKYEVSVPVGRGLEKQTYWVAAKLGLPIKMECRERQFSLEYKSIREEKVPDRLFALPPGLKKLDSIGGFGDRVEE